MSAFIVGCNTQDSPTDGKGLFSTEARPVGSMVCDIWGELRVFDSEQEAAEHDPHCVQILDSTELQKRLEDGETLAGPHTRLYLVLDKSCPAYYINSSRGPDNKPGPESANCRLVSASCPVSTSNCASWQPVCVWFRFCT